MHRKSTTLAATMTVAAAVVLLPGSAAAGTRAPTTVTIAADGTDLSGRVVSPKPAECADGRKVRVFKQIGTRGGGDDEFVASDLAGKQGENYVWSTGNTGEEGKFYARVRRTADCKKDASETVETNQPM